jgi:hypothetical protein
MANEIPPKSAFHFRLAVKADTPSIVAAEHNSNSGYAAFQRALARPSGWKPSSEATSDAVKTSNGPEKVELSEPEEAELSKAAAHSNSNAPNNTGDDEDFEYVYKRLVDPTVTYVVIGYFRDPSLRPGPGPDGEIPMIQVPSEEEAALSKEHIVGFAQWKFVKGRSPEEWEIEHEKARKARSPRLNKELLEATSDKRWEGRKRILTVRDHYSTLLESSVRTQHIDVEDSDRP